MKLKQVLKPLVPKAAIELYRRRLMHRMDSQFDARIPAEVFSDVYRRQLWGGSDTHDFCSGEGSRNEAYVEPYVAAVRKFLSELEDKPAVVDLGCGDFNVGSRLRDACGAYIACDVVPDLIARNARKFASLGVDFRTVDLVADDLPQGEVAFLRQVLQHLGNDQIARIVPKLYRYRWLILTEHLPETADFPANRDKSAGPGLRVWHRSGVVLTKPPFNLRASAEKVLCSVPGAPGVVTTVAYALSAAGTGEPPAPDGGRDD